MEPTTTVQTPARAARGDSAPSEAPQAAQFWDKQYGARDRIWSGRVNATMAAIAATLEPGRALELGSGEGADAIWLAAQGWQVLGVDVSAVAIHRAASHAASLGIDAGRARFQQHDLANGVPGITGGWQLITASFLQSPIELDRAGILRAAADALAPGGHLLIVTHAAAPPWAATEHHDPAKLRPAAAVLRELSLSEQHWTVERAEDVQRETNAPDGTAAVLLDGVVLVRSLG